jgi:hypothetical protein
LQRPRLGCKGGLCVKSWIGLLGGKHIVAQHADDKGSSAGAYFVAVGKSGFLDARAIEESAVATVEIKEATAFWTEIDGEVEAGHSFVVGDGVVSFRVAADTQMLARG